MSNGNSNLIDKIYSPEKLLKELGMRYSPSKELYTMLIKKTQEWATKGFLKNSFEVKGAEYLEKESYQIFAFNHELYEDPIMIQTAIALASGDNTPIPAPGHKDYIFFPLLGQLMQKLNSYVLYSEKDGYIKNAIRKRENKKKEKSLRYSEYCLFKYGRFLIFPVGSLSYDGKQIKGVRFEKQKNGTYSLKRIKGHLGCAEIAFRANKILSQKKFLKGKKLQIIPGYISYDPLDFISKRKRGSKVIVRFGNSLDSLFKEQVIDEYNSLKNKIKSFKSPKKKKELKESLQKKFMDDLMEEIGSLITISVEHLCSRILYNTAINKKYSLNNACIEKKDFNKKLFHLVDALKFSDLFFSCYFENRELTEKFCNLFLRDVEKKGFIKQKKETLKLNLEKICFEPFFKNVRKENRILYNFNKLEHLDFYKEIEKQILGLREL